MTETENETRDYTGVTTEQIVVEMLTENTGSSLCDSGGAYGRNWSLNQGKVFADEPKVRCTFDAWKVKGGDNRLEASVTISLYHWMVSCLEFDPEMQAELEEFAFREDSEVESHLGLQEQFADYLHERDGHEKMPNTINTYNNPDTWDCSQVLQYVELYIGDRYEPSHLIVSVHGGCDVRGGYTAPKCFKLSEEYYQALDHACAKTFGTSDYWWDYDGASWGHCESSEGTPCKDILAAPCFKLEDLLGECLELANLQAALARLPQDIKNLEATGLSQQGGAEAVSVMTAWAEHFKGERLGVAAEFLSTKHELCTLVDNKRLYLVQRHPDKGGRFEEVTAFSNL